MVPDVMARIILAGNSNSFLYSINLSVRSSACNFIGVAMIITQLISDEDHMHSAQREMWKMPKWMMFAC